MIKQQCRVDFSYDDDLLTAYGNTAEETVAQYLGRGKKVSDMAASLTEEYGGIPESVKTAALLLVSNWYKHSVPASNASMAVVPYTFEFIIKPYILL